VLSELLVGELPDGEVPHLWEEGVGRRVKRVRGGAGDGAGGSDLGLADVRGHLVIGVLGGVEFPGLGHLGLLLARYVDERVVVVVVGWQRLALKVGDVA